MKKILTSMLAAIMALGCVSAANATTWGAWSSWTWSTGETYRDLYTFCTYRSLEGFLYNNTWPTPSGGLISVIQAINFGSLADMQVTYGAYNVQTSQLIQDTVTYRDVRDYAGQPMGLFDPSVWTVGAACRIGNPS